MCLMWIYVWFRQRWQAAVASAGRGAAVCRQRRAAARHARVLRLLTLHRPQPGELPGAAHRCTVSGL